MTIRIHIIISFFSRLLFGGCSASSVTTDSSQAFKISYFTFDSVALSTFNANSDSSLSLPKPLRRIVPGYRPIAVRARVEGDVLIKAWVKDNGNVWKDSIVQSSQDIFNQSVVDATIHWQFTPFIKNGKQQPFVVFIPFSFQLKGLKQEVLVPE